MAAKTGRESGVKATAEVVRSSFATLTVNAEPLSCSNRLI